MFSTCQATQPAAFRLATCAPTWVEGDSLYGIVSLIHAEQLVSQLKSVVAQADDHEV